MTKMMSDSIRLEPELNDQVTALAEALDRSPSWVVEQAVRDYLAVQEGHLAAIDQGLREADAGLLIPHEEVAAWIESLGTPGELPIPRPK
ncbi:CopG family ribbon-helix-helix protein [Azospirillum sp. B4]|uniref:CopG family ribbon-helix-helix protein n=1 Tax=Azospirillum sp. B4 TaxID=95605 RepID=UPI0005CA4234|nr:CopG family ribbon-helix-helix protein [Azospirillum sp. B4]